MQRTLFLAGVGYLVLSGAWVVGHRMHRQQAHPGEPVPTPVYTRPGLHVSTSGAEWFAAIKPRCNAVEVELAQRDLPAPWTAEGRGYSAACYALAGKIEQARSRIRGLADADRRAAASIVFDVAHPVADAGDDRSAGPIMELVIEYIPDHSMALYHAGMSEFALGQDSLARAHLESFLTYYHENDGWTQNAKDVLTRWRLPNPPTPYPPHRVP